MPGIEQAPLAEAPSATFASTGTNVIYEPYWHPSWAYQNLLYHEYPNLLWFVAPSAPCFNPPVCNIFGTDGPSRLQTFPTVQATSPEPTHHSESSKRAPDKRTNTNTPSALETDTIEACGDGKWRCTAPGCESKPTFSRLCSARRHQNLHARNQFSTKISYERNTRSSTKQKVACKVKGCERTFARADNMRAHTRRVHLKKKKENIK
jgi:hypothetical protein